MKDKTVLVLAIGLVLVALFAVVGPHLGGDSNENTVTATGVAELEAVADEIQIHVRVEITDKTAAEAQKWTQDTFAETMEAIQEYTVGAEIETVRVSVRKEYSWDDGKRTFKGYKAERVDKITVTDPVMAAKIIDGAPQASGLIDYINFGLSKEKQAELKKQALKEATQNARLKAESMADGLGVKLGKVVSVSESDFQAPIYRMAMAEMAVADEAKSVGIAPQKLDVTARVNAVYKVK